MAGVQRRESFGEVLGEAPNATYRIGKVFCGGFVHPLIGGDHLPQTLIEL